MASIGYVRSLLGGIEADLRRVFFQVFEHILGNLRVGLPGHQKRAENFAWVQLEATTPAVANTEFSIEHGMGAAPRVAFPCLDLTGTGTQFVALINSRPADERRLYLKSPSTSALVTLYAEQR